MAAPANLLQIIQRACDELTLNRPAAVIAATDPQIRQLLAFVQAEGRFLMEDYDWSFLRVLYTFSTSNGTSTYAVPSDFDRYIPDTFWNRTQDKQLFGPETAQADRYRQESISGQVSTRQWFRHIGSNIQIFPTPTATETIVYEYISNKWARSSGGTAQTEFLVDTDLSYFDPYLLISGLKLRWRAAKGLDAQAAFAEYDRKYSTAKGKDNSGETLLLVPSDASEFIGMDNVPDTGYGQ